MTGNMRVLVAGGAGFIGSHMTKMLRETGHEAVVYDNLSHGHRDAVSQAQLVVGDLADSRRLDSLFAAHRFDVVMHFASFIEVGESVSNPAKYYRNNLANMATLLAAMAQHGVARIIFSSSAAVYGEPGCVPIRECHPQQPVNPYGRTKHMAEKLLADYGRVHGLGYTCLRYFNAAGSDPDGMLGERHTPETHLIPLALQAASGRRPCVTVFGTDYDTPDGTCIRDYVHVTDICRAHLRAMDRLCAGATSGAFNLGSENGYSVREVVQAVSRVTGRPVPVVETGRRRGDATRLVADARLARSELAWSPRYPDLDTMIAHAWAWEQKTVGAESRRTGSVRVGGLVAASG